MWPPDPIRQSHFPFKMTTNTKKLFLLQISTTFLSTKVLREKIEGGIVFILHVPVCHRQLGK